MDKNFEIAEFESIMIIEIGPFLVLWTPHFCTTAIFTKLNEIDKMAQKTPSTVETYNFLLLHAIFYHSVGIRSFECVVRKKFANYFVVWQLEHV